MLKQGALAVAGISLLIALPAFAQVNLGPGSSLIIVADPADPGPGQTVTLTAESPLLDLSNSTVTWSVNGASAGEGTSITTVTGALGKPTSVSVSVSGQSGDDSAQISLVPTSIDLLWEANTYAPPLYLGRATPTSGATIRLWAIPRFVESGAAVPSSKITFTWKLNGAVQKSQSGVGKDSITVPAAILYDSDTIEVDAQTSDGALSGEAQISIRTQEPQIVLYQDNPLFGVMYYQALGPSSAATQSQTSFAAVPYFAAVSSPSDPRLSYAWSVNDAPVAATSSDPSEITIDASSTGTAQIALSFSEPSDPFVSGGGSWAVSFGANSGSSGGNVFQTGE